jgi:hypothetical protein
MLRHRSRPNQPGPRSAGSLVPAILLSASGVLLFGVENGAVGYSMLAMSLVTAALIDREFVRHLALVAAGMVIISLVPLNADLSISHMTLMGGALELAVLVPWLESRFVYREKIIRFPVNTGRKWPLSGEAVPDRCCSTRLPHSSGVPDQHRGLPKLAGRLRPNHLLAAFSRRERRWYLGRVVLYLYHLHTAAATLPGLAR